MPLLIPILAIVAFLAVVVTSDPKRHRFGGFWARFQWVIARWRADTGAITFIPEIWVAAMLESLKKRLVFGQPTVSNRDYEGEIANQGDTVRIRSISRPTVSNYSKYGTLTYEQLTDAQRTLLIDQAKSFSFVVDDIDRAQAPGGELEGALAEATYALADLTDQFLAGLYTGVQAANNLGTVAVPTATPLVAYDSVLVPLKVKLDEANVPAENRFCVIPPWFHGRLLRDDRFVRVDASGNDQALRNGIVGRAAGFDMLVSNNAPFVTGDDYEVVAGYPGAISYAEQITEVETLRLQTTFGTGVRGLHLYGGKLVRPDGLAVCQASIT